MKTIYLAVYACLKRDLHKDQQIEPNDFKYIKQYHDSVKKLNLGSVILTDGSSQGFEHAHNTGTIQINNYNNRMESCTQTFDNDRLIDRILLHDERFLYFYQYVLDNPSIDYFMLTDVSDVQILNPIETIIEPSEQMLYISKENEIIDKNLWFNEWIESCPWLDRSRYVHDFRQVFDNRIILNCGVIFGHRDTMLRFLEKVIFLMCGIYTENHNISRPLDMFLINYVAYRSFSGSLYQGNDLTTGFGQNQYDLTKAVKHK